MKKNKTMQTKWDKDSCFSNNYSEIVRHFRTKPCKNNNVDSQHAVICDPPLQETKTKRIKEELVRCIWYGQHYKNNKLISEDGSRLEVISPGAWNVEGGPDFHHSEILFSNGGLKKGDVEVHVYSTDWIRHGHTLQDTYNKVCLHVTMWNDREEAFVYNKNGDKIPQLALHKYLDAELDELFEHIDTKKFPECISTNTGPCNKNVLINELSRDRLGIFLDYAGDERIALKAKRFTKSLVNGTFEQTLYESIMEALGYKNNKAQFLQLANILKFNDIQEMVPIDLNESEKILYIQAMFLGMAGLLPSQLQKKEQNSPDRETEKYIKEIEDIWDSKILDRPGKQPMDGKQWQFSKSRPANFPTRRIAAMSHIIYKCLNNGGLLKLILSVFERVDSYKDNKKQYLAIRKGIESIFLEIIDDFWSSYYIFYGKRLSTPERLIGKERVSDILINIIIPLLLINARKDNNIALEKQLHLVFRMHPCLSSNNITRFMTNRIFGIEAGTEKVIHNVRRQQGLHQIFKDFCDSDNHLCDKCTLYLYLCPQN